MDRAEKPGTCLLYKLMIHGGGEALVPCRYHEVHSPGHHPGGLGVSGSAPACVLEMGAFLVDVVAAGSRIQAPIRHVMIGEGARGEGWMMMGGPVATVYIPLAWADGGVEAGVRHVFVVRETSPRRSHNCRERRNNVQAINVYTEDRRISITLILKDIYAVYIIGCPGHSLWPPRVDDGRRSHLFGSSTVVGRVRGGGGRDASFFLSLSLS